MKSTLVFSIMALATLPSVLAGTPSCYDLSKAVTFTNYWISKEGTTDMDNDGNIVHLTGDRNTPLQDVNGNTIAMVSSTTFSKCQMEGTCLLESGKLANLDNGKSAFKFLDRTKEPYGEGYAEGVALDPFVTIATNDLPHGSTVYIKELDNLKLPNGKTHNGCVRVQDDSWSFDGCHIDWFVLEYPMYVSLNTPDNVHAEVRSCTILNYITASIQEWGLLGNVSPPPTTTTTTDTKKHTTTTTTKKHTTTTTTKKHTTTTTEKHIPTTTGSADGGKKCKKGGKKCKRGKKGKGNRQDD